MRWEHRTSRERGGTLIERLWHLRAVGCNRNGRKQPLRFRFPAHPGSLRTDAGPKPNHCPVRRWLKASSRCRAPRAAFRLSAKFGWGIGQAVTGGRRSRGSANSSCGCRRTGPGASSACPMNTSDCSSGSARDTDVDRRIEESLSLSRIRLRRSRTPAFRAGMRGWLGDFRTALWRTVRRWPSPSSW